MAKSQLLGSTALAGLLVAPTAFAGDFTPVRYPESQKLQWSGFYAGANAGYAAAQDPFTGCMGNIFPCPNPNLTARPTPGVSASGGLFGVQAGYNWQVGQFVFGMESDVQKLFVNGTNQFAGVDPAKGPDRLSAGYDWLGTTRARAGIAQGPWLFYATGGLAYGRVNHEYLYAIGAPTATADFSLSENRLGWTLGGGAEYAINRNWSLKAEYLYVQLARSNLDVSRIESAAPGSAVLRFNNNLNIFRLGANYRF